MKSKNEGGWVGTAIGPAAVMFLAGCGGGGSPASTSPAAATLTAAAAAGSLPVPLGGVDMDQTGFRNAPSLAYASFTPPFSIASGPTGGFFRDGRASSLAAQAQQPFLTSFEMANHDAAEVVGRLRQSSATLQKFIDAFGDAALGDAETALEDIGVAALTVTAHTQGFTP